jgi:hypothetical protein
MAADRFPAFKAAAFERSATPPGAWLSQILRSRPGVVRTTVHTDVLDFARSGRSRSTMIRLNKRFDAEGRVISRTRLPCRQPWFARCHAGRARRTRALRQALRHPRALSAWRIDSSACDGRRPTARRQGLLEVSAGTRMALAGSARRPEEAGADCNAGRQDRRAAIPQHAVP